MLEEMVRAIQDAEARAGQICDDAQQQALRRKADAKRQAEENSASRIAKARTKADEAISTLEKQGQEQQRKAAQETAAQCQKMKDDARKKHSKVIDEMIKVIF